MYNFATHDKYFQWKNNNIPFSPRFSNDHDDVHFDLTPRSGLRSAISAEKNEDKPVTKAESLLKPSAQEKKKSEDNTDKPGRSDRVRFGDK